MEFLNFIPCAKCFAYNIFGFTFVLFLQLSGPDISIKSCVFDTHNECLKKKLWLIFL